MKSTYFTYLDNFAAKIPDGWYVLLSTEQVRHDDKYYSSIYRKWLECSVYSDTFKLPLAGAFKTVCIRKKPPSNQVIIE